MATLVAAASDSLTYFRSRYRAPCCRSRDGPYIIIIFPVCTARSRRLSELSISISSSARACNNEFIYNAVNPLCFFSSTLSGRHINLRWLASQL